MTSRVLLVQTDVEAARSLARFFEERGDEIWHTHNLEEAVALLDLVNPDILFLDLHFPDHEWLNFLHQTRQNYPDLKIVVTNKTPDVQREFQAQNRGVKVFLRQPFTRKWLERALDRLEHQSAPEPIKTPDIKVIFPFFLKVFLPYLVLGILVLGIGAVVFSQWLKDVDSGWVQKDAISGKHVLSYLIAEEQESLLQAADSLVEMQAVYQPFKEGDREALALLVEPVLTAGDCDAVEFLDTNGITLLSLRADLWSSPRQITAESGDTFFDGVEFIKRIRFGLPADSNHVEAGMVSAPWGNYFYVARPLMQDGSLSGILLVGKSLYSLGGQFGEVLGKEIAFYDSSGMFVQSTVAASADEMNLSYSLVRSALNTSTGEHIGRTIFLNNQRSLELLLAWKAVGGENIALLGIANPYTQAEAFPSSRLSMISLLAILYLLLALLIAWMLAKRVKDFSYQYSQAAVEISDGNLETKMDNQAGDELSQLSGYMNYMVAGLQEHLLERDLFGVSVSHGGKKRSQRSFSVRNLQLEGCETAVSVLRIQPVDFSKDFNLFKVRPAFAELSELYQQAASIALQTGDAVFNFEGEALMIYFGLFDHTLAPAEGVSMACSAAHKIMRALALFNEERGEQGAQTLRMNIFIDHGVLATGVLHIHDRLTYGVSGAWLDALRKISLENRLPQTSHTLVSATAYDTLAELRKRFVFSDIEIEGSGDVSGPGRIYRLI